MKSQKKATFWTLLLLCISFVGNSYAQEFDWQEVKIGAKDERYMQIHFLGNFGWVATKDELWVTRDGGDSWSLVFTVPKAEVDPDRIITIEFLNSQVGWVVTGDLGEWNDVYQTSDGGQSWQKVDYRVETTHPKKAGIPPSLKNLHFFNLQEGLGFFIFLGAVTQDGSMIARTDDGGKTWNQIYLTTGETYIDDLEFSKSSSWFLYDASGFFIQSLDQGKSLHEIPNRQRIFAFDFVFPEVGLGLSTEGTYPAQFYVLNFTLDSGVSWIPLQKIPQNLIPGTDGFVMDLLFPSLQEGWILWVAKTPIERPRSLILLYVQGEEKTFSEIPLPVHSAPEGSSFSATDNLKPFALNIFRREIWVIANGFTPRLLKAKIPHAVSVSPKGKFFSTWGAIKKEH